jgi:hypothetical protein
MKMRASGTTAAVAGEHSDGVEDRLEQAALLLEEMARELRKMKSRESVEVPLAGGTYNQEAPEVPLLGEADLQVGHRVRVVWKDKYYGRTGVVMHRHGRLFWDVRLDASVTRAECTIFKKDASLTLIPGS